MNPLTEIFGSKTKVRIITVLSRMPEGLTRNAVRKEIGTSTTRVYEQMEQLRAVGVLKNIDGRYSLDDRFPFNDLISELVLAMNGYYDFPASLLNQIDALFADRYYLTGFMAATAYITPIDYELWSVRVGLLRPEGKWMAALGTLDRASEYSVTGFAEKRMPADIERHRIYHADVWCSSLERSVVDCLTSGECSTYGSYLIFCQYILEGGPNIEKLSEVAVEMSAVDLVGTLARQIDGTELTAPFEVVEISRKELGHALNTIRGG